MENFNVIRQPKNVEAVNDNESDPQLCELEAALAANFIASPKSGDLHLTNDSGQVSDEKTAYQNFLRANPDVLQKVLKTKTNSQDAFQQQLYALASEVDAIAKRPTELAA